MRTAFLVLVVLLVLLSACATEKIVTVTKYQCYDNTVSDTLEGCPVQPNARELLAECTARLSGCGEMLANATAVLSTCDFKLNELAQVIAQLEEPAKNMTINVTDIIAQLRR
ncbi:MAG: hypothetical protein QXT19_02545 [Candidatus Woesearchaeota archaeon]